MTISTLRQANWATWGPNISALGKKFGKELVTIDLDTLTPQKFGQRYELTNPLSDTYLEPRKTRNVFDKAFVIAEHIENGKFSVTCRHMETDTQFSKNKQDMTITYRLTDKVYSIVEETDCRELAMVVKEDRRMALIKRGLSELIGVLPV